jgi:hypothetical protein
MRGAALVHDEPQLQLKLKLGEKNEKELEIYRSLMIPFLLAN